VFTYVMPAPTILGLSQSSGPAAGGTSITITGTDLDGATAVDFGTTPATIVAGSDTGTQITVIVPAETATRGTGGVGGVDSGNGGLTVDVTVTTPGGMSSTSLLDQFTWIASPAVSSVTGQAIGSSSTTGGGAGSIAAGPTSGGTEVLITGTGLAGATAVYFGTTTGTIVSDADMYIVADSPQGAGTVEVTVTTPYGTSPTSSADQFTYVAAPSATADSYTTTVNSPLMVPASSGVLANDTDPQGLPLTATLVTEPADGTLSFNSDGSFTYTPDSGYIGPDSFTYEATNGYVSSPTQSVQITVNSGTMIWEGGTGGTGSTGSTGNWTASQWSGATSTMPYPDATVSAIVNTPSVVQVTSNQAAYALSLSNGGEVAVGAGAILTVTNNFNITGGGTLSVDPNGAFFVGGTVTFDAGSLSGGPVSAAAYQLNDGTVSADLAGPGGVTVGSVTGGSSTVTASSASGFVGNTVTLSGTNSYAGGTTVNAGTLVITSASALPDGTSLTIGAGGTFVFDPSQAASNVSAAGLAAAAPEITVASESSTPIVVASALAQISVTTPIPSTLAPIPERQGEEPSFLPVTASPLLATSGSTLATPAAMSSVARDAVFASLGPSAARTAPVTGTVQSARPWAWLAAIENAWQSSDQNRKDDAAVAALDKVLARFSR
jgi:autotransporter-associated beta strand protein